MPEIKITGGALRSRKITFSAAETLRPTLSKTREAIFNVLANYIEFEGASFLDTFSGSGIMAFEAYSRGFSRVICIESNRKTYANIKENVKLLSVNVTPLYGMVPATFDKSEHFNIPFTVIFLDPPYQSDLYSKTVKKIEEKNLLQENGILVIESERDKNIVLQGFEIIQQKIYSDKLITFLKK